ncbi:serine/threonine-protein kinase [Corallococcus sp. CA031C]
MRLKDEDSGGVTYLSAEKLDAQGYPRPERTPVSDGTEATFHQVTPPMSPMGTLIQGAVTPPGPAALGLVPGQVVAERYRVEKWLGVGGTSTVYQALDLKKGQRVALKVLAVPHADEAMVTRFRQEVEHARALEHVNILHVFDVGWDGERHYLTVELLEGRDLRQMLLEGRPTLASALRWLTHATVALEHAHAHGVLHRDVKPGNLFITRTGVLKLMDFGLAKSTHVVGATAQGATLGTPEYMAPEQVMGTGVSPATDLYALGVVAYELFTGQLPFRHAQPVPLMFLHVQEAPAPLRKLRPDLPESFEQLVLRLMQKRPEDRFPSATGLRAALAELWPQALKQTG